MQVPCELPKSPKESATDRAPGLTFEEIPTRSARRDRQYGHTRDIIDANLHATAMARIQRAAIPSPKVALAYAKRGSENDKPPKVKPPKVKPPRG
jgi:hypothetical protein